MQPISPYKKIALMFTASFAAYLAYKMYVDSKKKEEEEQLVLPHKTRTIANLPFTGVGEEPYERANPKQMPPRPIQSTGTVFENNPVTSPSGQSVKEESNASTPVATVPK